MERPTCETCPYWDPFGPKDEGEDDGECRRYPPSLASSKALVREGNSVRGDSSGTTLGWSPVTPGCYWCGEHPRFAAYLESWRGHDEA